MSEIPDLTLAATTTAAVVAAIPDAALSAPTPSSDYRVGDLVEHVEGLSWGLQRTARKLEVPPAELRDGDATQLQPGWRERIPGQLADLAHAWSDPAAWHGDTVQGGVPVPAAASGMFVLNELVVHGWELARATGQQYVPDEGSVLAALEFLRSFPRTEDADRVFGPVVAVPDSAPALDRLLGLTGRDPGWRPGR